jgi:hypothetical protein
MRALRKPTVGAALPTKEETMIRTLMFAAVSAAALLLSPIAFAQQTGGTADEAKAIDEGGGRGESGQGQSARYVQ